MLSRRAFASLWAARDISALGDWIFLVALLTWSYRAKESAAVVSIVVVGRLLPTFLLGFLAGRVVSRRRGQWIAVVAQLLQAAALVPLLDSRAGDGLLFVIGLASLAALPSAFSRASHDALLPAAVGAGHLAGARRALSISRFLPLILGPAAGTFVYEMAGLQSAVVANLGALALSTLFLLLAGPPRAGMAPTGAEGMTAPRLSSIQEGLACALSHPPLRTVAAIGLIAALATGSLMIAQTAFMVWGLFTGVENVGKVLAAQGLGLAVGSALYLLLRDRLQPTSLVSSSLYVSGAAALGFALTSSLNSAAVMAGMLGLANGIAVLSLTSLALRLAPDRLQASVSAGLDKATEAAVVLSAVLMGPFSDTIGPRFTIVLASIILTVLALYAYGALADREGAPVEEVDRAMESGHPAAQRA